MSHLEQIQDAIQSTNTDDDELNGAVLTGWILVGEWLDPEGERWLSKMSGSPAGKPVPSWQERGYLYEVLNHFEQ